MMNEELWKRVGYIAGRLSETFPECSIETWSFKVPWGMATDFIVRDETGRSIVEYELTHAAIEDVHDVEILVQVIVHSVQRRGR